LSVVVTAAYVSLPDYNQAVAQQRSRAGTAVFDRNGELLRLFPDGRGRFSLWSEVDKIPIHLKQAVIAAEDQRFYYHPGFDPIAVLRALYTNFSQGKTVSGASTITQQVVRLIHPRPRTFRSKIIELAAAMKMEWQLSKDSILELHLNLSPMGGNMRGVRLAARKYFNKEVKNISVAEAAALAALPRSPSRFDPRRPKGRKLLNAEKNRVLERMAELGIISADTQKLMSAEALQFRIRQLPLEAPHLVDFVMTKELPNRESVKTAIDLSVQHEVERILHSHRNRLSGLGIEQVGAVVSSVRDSKVIASVGSLQYGRVRLGYNNAFLARRSAGSILKPFLYALALEQGYSSYSEIADTFRTYPTPQGNYQPYNADRRWYGPVNIRLALGNSLNMPAVKALKETGPENFFRLLERVGVVDQESGPVERYGLGLAIGNLEVSLLNLVQAYGCLARGGLYQPLGVLSGAKEDSIRILSQETAYVINHILADPSARLLTFGNPSYFDFGFPVSVKTGTSANYRDSWIVAYTSEHVVGLWAGNFGGRPTSNVAAATALGQILKQIIRRLYAAAPPAPFERPVGVQEEYICWMSGKPASPKCPHVMKELVIGRTRNHTECDVPHENDHHYYLGAAYANWLDHKERVQGKSRFRLESPDRVKKLSVVPAERLTLMGRPRIEIVSPHHLDRFVLSSRSSGRVLFRAVPNPVVSHVVWMLDGVEIARTQPPYEFFWELTRGRHTVHAITPNREAAEVTIHVE
jgi:penicillin-binding protein 1C